MCVGFFGVDATVLAGVGIGFASGISVVAMACSIGAVSGAHLNPVVSMGALVPVASRFRIASGTA